MQRNGEAAAEEEEEERSGQGRNEKSRGEKEGDKGMGVPFLEEWMPSPFRDVPSRLDGRITLPGVPQCLHQLARLD